MNLTKSIYMLFAILLISSCEKGPDLGNVDFDRTALLNNYVDNILIPRYNLLTSTSEDLENACLAFQTMPDQNNLELLRNQYKVTYLAWQACSSAEFGPAGMQTLKAIFNTYPVDTPQIFSNINSGSYNLESAQNIAAIGLPAVDFLLFGLGNTDAEILNALNNQNVQNYLLDVSALLATKSNLVSAEWNSSYRSSFVQANGTDVGSSLGMIVNEMNLDFERFIRDGKVGIPLGKRSLGTPQLDKLEAVYAVYSLELLQESIKSLKELYTGTSAEGIDGLGMDDYLDAVKASHSGQNLNTTILNQFEAIETSMNVINTDLATAILNNPTQVEDLYNAMQQMVVYLKVDLASNLGILISYQDNDGD